MSSAHVTCSRCGDLYSANSSKCPTCSTPRTGEEVATRQSPASNVAIQPVAVKDFDMPFGSMVSFMVRWTIAAIPAMIILFIVFAIIAAIMGGFVGSLLHSR